MALPPRFPPEESESVEDRVTLAMREMLLRGDFVPGQKLVEATIAERLNVSRMPVRRALAVLERDGLVTNEPNRGSFAARFTIRQVTDARALRGTLEGFAARQVAERGLSPAVRRELEAMLQSGDEMFKTAPFSASDAEAYRQLNYDFHMTIVAAAENKPLMMAYEANNRLPLASPIAVTVDSANLEEMARTLRETQSDHYRIVAALKNGQGSRADALMQEHVQTAIESFLAHSEDLGRLDPASLPGLRLVIG